ncbi:MAG: FHA domain-containing protein [Actinobacteria bacterium]|nr:FHA domain-containing protein [Actinomycetota bacterium]NBQ60271.1 FHA domain-containing protein [Actinomycetota bacterium]NBY82206.1 FHA domain-containing protein [Actinomycetota bacterium]NCA26052.1 FHA domain-containing protein [Actinomycetota bacterium]NCU78519.1 FHA domain-containing protein [Actinomycetota bacterium]
MADKVTPPSDLTSTLNLRQLRSIPGSIASDELYKSLSSEQQSIVTALKEGVGILLVLKGAGIGGRYLLDSSETKIGRDLNNEICLDDITVSRSHALISRTQEGYSVKDLGSLNGTYLNAISVRDSKILNGDEIQIGKYHLTLFIGGK